MLFGVIIAQSIAHLDQDRSDLALIAFRYGIVPYFIAHKKALIHYGFLVSYGSLS